MNVCGFWLLCIPPFGGQMQAPKCCRLVTRILLQSCDTHCAAFPSAQRYGLEQWRPCIGLPSLRSPRGCDWLQPCAAPEVLGPSPAQSSYAHHMGRDRKQDGIMSDPECGIAACRLCPLAAPRLAFSITACTSRRLASIQTEWIKAAPPPLRLPTSSDPVNVQHLPATN